MLREEYENLNKGDLLVEYFLGKEISKNNYVFFSREPNNFLLAQPKESLEIKLGESSLISEVRRKYFEDRPIRFHYLDLELSTTQVIYNDGEIYRKLSVRYKKVPTQKENKVKGIYRIKPVGNRELYIEFKGQERKSGIIPYSKLPNCIQELNLPLDLFDMAYISRDGCLSWYIPHHGIYKVSPNQLYNLL